MQQFKTREKGARKAQAYLAASSPGIFPLIGREITIPVLLIVGGPLLPCDSTGLPRIITFQCSSCSAAIVCGEFTSDLKVDIEFLKWSPQPKAGTDGRDMDPFKMLGAKRINLSVSFQVF